MATKREDIVKIAGVGKKVWLRCRSCWKTWNPDARKWRGKLPVEEKILRCPHCNVKNRVPRVVVEFLVEQAKKETEYGWGKVPDE
jgi:DNA-directed RNA polymerase subunit RPC12/RpoP